ncbi:MAG: hypothetical protein ABI596_16095 [Pyrinomonadaceae bacterium]
MTTGAAADWGEASEPFDRVKTFVTDKDLSNASEAQTRFDVIDRLIKEVLGWSHGQITVEERDEGETKGFVDYILRSGDHSIVIEAKKIGATFPSPTRKKLLKLSGSVLGSGAIYEAVVQARRYASSKGAVIAIVTNGLCWCYFSLEEDDDEAYAGLFFPFGSGNDGERLFDLFSCSRVESGSLENIRWIKPPRHENRLLYEVLDSAARVDRNNIADHIAPALNNAFYADALLQNASDLEWCFVKTEARTKFDSMLGVYLVDPKPASVKPARRIRKAQARGHLETLVKNSDSRFAPPVTLIIGSVGSGKSTYLKHFELVSGKGLLAEERVHWIYIDFEKMGRGGNPREFLYENLKQYLIHRHPNLPTDFRDVVEPAYREEIAGLARGPYALIASKTEQFNTVVAEYIGKEYQQIEPYVDKVFKYITGQNMCVVVLDNIDLYEDDQLETTVFSEGLALSKRIQLNVIVCIRDKTYVRHRNSSAFDAFDLRKFWLDPPPFDAVLSKRLSLSKRILEGKQANIELSSGARLNVPDLSVFFDIVQKSVLTGESGDFIDAFADENIRKGLTLVTNFLTSGHIQADKAVGNYLKGDYGYQFPFHEVFKGTMLGQWKYFREERAECLNLFDSRLGAKSLRLLRLFIVRFLMLNARDQNEVEVPVRACIDLFSKAGASEAQILEILNYLYQNGLVRNIAAEDILDNSTIAITRRGGYLARFLIKRFVYVEECLYDTAIEDENVWQELRSLTDEVERQRGVPAQMVSRKQRMEVFLNYLQMLESRFIELLGDDSEYLATNVQIRRSVLREVGIATSKAIRFR